MFKASLYEKIENKKIHCYLCAHECTIIPGAFGFCGVRRNVEGELFTYAYGSLIAQNIDPIEKKPLYHFLPGSKTYSIATIGCNFRCGFCQNWQISQLKASDSESVGQPFTPEEIVKDAIRHQCESIAFTYTEPTIFFEYAFDTAKIAKESGLKTVFVSNGYMSLKALEKIRPYLDACNIDLKSFRNEFYAKNCKAKLDPVLSSIKKIKDLGIWIEITTLLITGENDSEQEMKDIAEFIAHIDKNIPWHVSRFFPQYKFNEHKTTLESTIFKAESIGHETGLNYVYPGNIQNRSITNCTKCNSELLVRSHFSIIKNNLTNNRCPKCRKVLEGIWK